MTNKKIHKEDDEGKLKSYSDVSSFDRLSDEDIEIASTITAGGDQSFLIKDIED